MKIMKLREYQEESKEAVLSEWADGVKKTLLVLPTGTGKTIVFSKIAEEKVRQGERVLILAHRGELLDQAADKIEQATGLGTSREQAEETSIGSWNRIVVGSVQSMVQEKRLSRFPSDYFGTIIVDETHHILSNTYKTVLNHFSEADVLGVTATPDRGDMQNLGQYFESLAYEYSMPKAIKEGFLAPIKALTIPLQLDISKVAQTGGDFAVGDLGNALDPYLESIADEMVKVCQDRKTLVFLPLIKTSKKFTEILNEKGFRAAEVNGQSKDREQVLKDFDDGKYNVLCNSMLLTEGYDSPEIDCVIVLRPTRVRSLYSQMVGRGTRIHPDKDHLLLLDFLWHTDRHELVHPAHLISTDDDVARRATQIIEEAGGAVDIEEAELEAAEDVTEEREEALAKHLEAQRRKKKRLVDPLQFAAFVNDKDFTNYQPLFGQDLEPATKEQQNFVEKEGIDPTTIESRGQANKIIEELKKRSENNLSTPKQIRQLSQRGYENVDKWTFDQAKTLINQTAANRWRTVHKSPGQFVPS